MEERGENHEYDFLYELMASGPYGSVHIADEQAWLVWSDEMYRKGDFSVARDLEFVFDRVFKSFGIFEYRERLEISLPLYPYACFLQDWNKLDWFTSEHSFKPVYEILVNHYLDPDSGRKVSHARFGELAAERDTFEKQVYRAGEQLSPLVDHIEGVLKAWLAEVLKGLESRYDSDDYRSRKWELITDAQAVWNLIIKGASLDDRVLNVFMRRLFNYQCASESLSNIQYEGLLSYMASREVVLEYAYPLNERRRALEWILHHVLLGIPIPMTEEANAQQQREKEERDKEATGRDGRVRGKHLEHDMVRFYWALHDSPGKDMSNPEIRAQVLVLFNNPISDRRFQDYIRDNDKPELTQEEIIECLRNLKDKDA